MFVVDASLNCVPAKNRVSPFVNARRQIGQGMKYVVQNHLSSRTSTRDLFFILFPNLPIEKRVTISVPYTEYKSFCARDPLSFRNLKNVKKEI